MPLDRDDLATLAIDQNLQDICRIRPLPAVLEQTQAATAQVSAIEGWELPQMFLPEQTQAEYAAAASGPR